MRKFLAALTLLSLIGIAAQAQTTGHDHHARHGMILFGEEKLYLDHIVYSAPHNYQVLLEIKLEDNVRDLYLKKRKENPAATFKFVSQPVDLKDIGQMPFLDGDIVLISGEEIVKGIKVEISKVIYFDELPF